MTLCACALPNVQMCSEWRQDDQGSSAGSLVSLSVTVFQTVCLLQLQLGMRQNLILSEDSLPEG